MIDKVNATVRCQRSYDFAEVEGLMGYFPTQRFHLIGEIKNRTETTHKNTS